MMTEYVSALLENIMMYSCSLSHWQTLITSRNKHVAHLMKAGHKCNKAAKVIRTATGHFTHIPRIGLRRKNMMKRGSRTVPFTKGPVEV